jgi:hypothetical protein
MRDVFAAGSDNELQSAVREAVRDMMTTLKQLWDVSSYGCPCAAGAAADVSCCDPDDPDRFLPETLQASRYTTLDGNTLVQGLFNAIGEYVEKVLWTHDAAPVRKYNLDLDGETPPWNKEQLILAADYGMMRTDIPLLEYNEEEVAEPFGGVHANVSLWRMCHGLLQQTHSTIPMGKDALPIGVFVGNKPSATAFSGESTVRQLERVVREMTQHAWETSPLHYSHVMRHLPTDSLLCESAYTGDNPLTPDETVSTRSIDSVVIDGIDVIHMDIPNIGHVHPHGGGLGASRYACLCGWTTPSAAACYIPESVCSSLPWHSVDATVARFCNEAPVPGRSLLDEKHYWVPRPGTTAEGGGAGDVVRDAVVAAWRPEWECTSMAPSESWGVTDTASMELWLTDAAAVGTLHAREILQGGRAGLRVGTLDQILAQKQWKDVLHPGKRTVPLTGPVNSSLGQRWCHKNKDAMFPASFADRFVDELFPVAQGVTENTGLAVCIRVVMEAARLRVLQLAAAGVSGDAAERLNEFIQTQEDILSRWRRRCLQQVETFGMCTLRGVFDIQPLLEEDQTDKCPFKLTRDANTRKGVWITPGCLVRYQKYDHAVYAFEEDIAVGGVRYFYPCNCMATCAGPTKTSVTITQLLNDPACTVPFDPKTFTQKYKHTSSLFWATDYTHEADTTTRNMLRDTVAVLHAERLRDHTGVGLDRLLEKYVLAPDGGKFGNVPDTKAWFEAEGVDGTSFCDLIHDWWPEQWDQPVGVHVTTPCHSSETSYRGFDSHFTVDRRDAANPKMVYQHDTLRDPLNSRNDFGLSGVCRMRSLGMPQQEINTMRFCTRMAVNARADPAVPLHPEQTGDIEYIESCAQSNRDVPWDSVGDERHDDSKSSDSTASTYGASAGVVLSWPELTPGGNMVWPAARHLFPLSVPKDVASSRWGNQGCGMPLLFTCDTDVDCHTWSLSRQGTLNFRCMGSTMPGGGGVCMVYDVGDHTGCVKHLDCANPDQMCSGDGICVDPVIAFHNTLSSEIAVQVYSTSCKAGERNETYGHSPWEQVPDILRSHGMCSHRKWFEYRELIKGSECPALDADTFDQGMCSTTTNGDNHWQSTGSYGETEIGKTKPLQQDGVLSVHAHVCDRDFMHMGGYAECRPGGLAVMRGVNDLSDVAPTAYRPGRTFATYTTPDNTTIPYARMPFFGNEQIGFLGTNQQLYTVIENDVKRDGSETLQSCSSIAQCSLQPWTVRGIPMSPRMVSMQRPYTLPDALQCGAFGFLKEDTLQTLKCALDIAVIPMFRMLCVSTPPTSSGCDVAPTTAATCVSLSHFLHVGYKTEAEGDHVARIRVLVNSLAKGIQTWSTGNTFAQYFRQVDCATWALNQMGQTTSAVQYTRTDEVVDGPLTMGSVGLYHFLQFAVYEVSPLWWVRCILFSSDVEFGDTSSTCQAWGDTSSQMDEPPHVWLARRAGAINATMVAEQHADAKRRLSANARKVQEQFNSFVTSQFPSEFHSDTVGIFNPWCAAGLWLNTDRVKKELAYETLQVKALKEVSPAAIAMLALVRQMNRATLFEKPIVRMDEWSGFEECHATGPTACVIPKEYNAIGADIFTTFIDDLVSSVVSMIPTPTKTKGGMIQMFEIDGVHPRVSATYQRMYAAIVANGENCRKGDDELGVQCLYTSTSSDISAGQLSSEVYQAEALVAVFSTESIDLVRSPFDTAWGEDAAMVAFELCRNTDKAPAAGVKDCGLRPYAEAVAPPAYSAGTHPYYANEAVFRLDRDNWIGESKEHGDRRCFSVNDECLMRTDYQTRDVDNEGHMITHVKDHRISKYTWVQIPPDVSLSVTHIQSTLLLSKGSSIAYEESFNGPWFVERDEGNERYVSKDDDSTCNSGHVSGTKVSDLKAECFYPAWKTLWKSAATGLGDVHSHIPRYVSDQYETHLRGLTTEAVLHLSTLVGGVYRALIRGISDTRISFAAFASSAWVPFTDVRFEERLVEKTPWRGTKFISWKGWRAKYEYYTRSPMVEGETGAPFAQFQHQLPPDEYDAAYPSALFLNGAWVYASTPFLKQMFEKKLHSALSAKTHGTLEDKVEYEQKTDTTNSKYYGCTGCVQVKAKWEKRGLDGGTLGEAHAAPIVSGFWSAEAYPTAHATPVVPWAHCPKSFRMRTLQTIIESGPTDREQPWETTHAGDLGDLKHVLTYHMPLLYVRWVDMNSGSDEAFNMWTLAKAERAKRLRANVEGSSLTWLKLATDGEAKAHTKVVNTYGSNDDCAVIHPNQFLDEYISKHFQEAKLIYVAAMWHSVSKTWFEVYNRPAPLVTKSGATRLMAIPAVGVIGYDFRLGPDLHCHPTHGSTKMSDEDALKVCGEHRMGVVVRPNLVRCRDCTSVRRDLCNGNIGCKPRPWLQTLKDHSGNDATDSNSPFTQRFAGVLRGHLERTSGVIDKETSMGVMLDTTRDMLLLYDSMLQLDDTTRSAKGWFRESTTPVNFGGSFDAMPITWDSWGAYNPVAATKYEKNTGVFQGGVIVSSACISAGETNFVDYSVCNQHQGLIFLNESFIGEFTRERGVRVPDITRGSWAISRRQLTEGGAIPFWAETSRLSRDRFASWLLDYPAHCLTADSLNSVCMKQGKDIKVFNPWLGGDYSPVDRCDSTWQASSDGYVLDTACPEDICEDAGKPGGGHFGLTQYSSEDPRFSCTRRNGNPSQDRIVGSAVPNNLCSKVPRVNTTCSHRQGTLSGPGSPAPSVYDKAESRHVQHMVTFRTLDGGTVPMDSRGGLFVQPRHSAFHGDSHVTSSGHAGAVRVSPHDIAGHHVRYVVDDEGLRVTDVLLGSYTTLQAAERTIGKSPGLDGSGTAGVGGTAWLRAVDETNDMRKAAPSMDVGQGAPWTDWACPLRQQQFVLGSNPESRMQFPDLRRAKVHTTPQPNAQLSTHHPTTQRTPLHTPPHNMK